MKKKICPNCFSVKTTDPCPRCGFTKASENRDPTILPRGTALAGKYRIGGCIGRGGFGITYLAYDIKNEKTVAIKEYFPPMLVHRERLSVIPNGVKSAEQFNLGAERFFTEADMVSRFNGNPNIVSIYDCFYENNTAYFAMEYLDGMTVENYVKKYGALTPQEVLYIADRLTMALIVLHSGQVLHRDISPDNVMLCGDGRVKLIDFGSARQFTAGSALSFTVLVKVGFTSPEQYISKDAGKQTDIYSLGTLLYYALTDKIPEVPYLRINDDGKFAERPDNVDQSLWNIVCRAAAVKACDRYENAEQIKAALDNIDLERCPVRLPDGYEPLKDNGVSAESALISMRAASNKRRYIIPAAVCGVVCICAAAAIPFSLHHFSSNIIQTDDEPNDIQTDDVPNDIQTDNEPKDIQTDNEPNDIQTDNEPNDIQTDDVPNDIQTDNEPKDIQTDNEPNVTQTENVPNDTQTDNEPNDIQTDNEPNDIQTDNEPNDTHTDNEPNDIQADNEPKDIQTDNEPNDTHTDNEPNDTHTDNEPNDTHTDNEPNDIHTDNEPNDTQTDNEPKDIHTDNEPNDIKTDNEPNDIKTDNEPHTSSDYYTIPKMSTPVELSLDNEYKGHFKSAGHIPSSYLRDIGGDVSVTVKFKVWEDAPSDDGRGFIPVNSDGESMLEYLSSLPGAWADENGYIDVTYIEGSYPFVISREGIEKLDGGELCFEAYNVIVTSASLALSEPQSAYNIRTYDDKNLPTYTDGDAICIEFDEITEVGWGGLQTGSIPKSAFYDIDGDVKVTLEVEHNPMASDASHVIHVRNSGWCFNVFDDDLLVPQFTDDQGRKLINRGGSYAIVSDKSCTECVFIIPERVKGKMSGGIFFQSFNSVIKSARLEKYNGEYDEFAEGEGEQ